MDKERKTNVGFPTGLNRRSDVMLRSGEHKSGEVFVSQKHTSYPVTLRACFVRSSGT
ncbi:hypothetical protein J6590_028488 [Homalodisca vitripennis]|nr:hypothetical protein J6590_028488 [Homalodisca vitripennis]